MASRKSPRSIDIAVGRVDATALDDLQENFDTQELFELVDALDECRGRIGDADGLRADVLRLQATAHTRVNGAPLSVSAVDAAHVHIPVHGVRGFHGNVNADSSAT
jgi:hypothetical protein